MISQSVAQERIRSGGAGMLCCLALLASSLAGCRPDPKTTNVNAAANPVAAPRSVTVLLFDLSKSVSPANRERYGDYANRFWNYVSKDAPASDRPSLLVGAVITGKSLAEQQEIFRATARDHSFSDLTESQEKWAAAMRREKKSVEAAKAQLKNTTTPNTEIMAALDFADRTFASNVASRHSLYIFSDMQEQSKDLDVGNGSETLSDRRITDIIEQQKKRGALPNLRGARVVVVGASSVNSDRYRRVRALWLAYFKAAKAELAESDYGDTLKLP